jgi:hypothetical protein
MRPFVLPLSILAALGLGAAPALAWRESLDTPRGLATVEGDPGMDASLRLMVGGRQLFETQDWYEIWPEAVLGNWLLLAVSEGGTACEVEWMWVELDSGATSPVFGTCGMVEGVSRSADGSPTATLYAYDLDWPRSNFVFDGTTVAEVPLPQEPAAVPPGAPADDWLGRYPYELFMASDWKGPLTRLLGKAGYDQAQEAFGQSVPFEVQGDWVAASACMVHACTALAGAIAIHRGDGRILVAMRPEGGPGQLFGEPGGPLPPALQEVMAGN